MWKSMDTNQKRMITILALINFLNYVDRQIVFPLFHHIQLDFGLTDFQLGLIGTVFVLVYSLTTIPLGIVADKYSRKILIMAGVLFWSVATFFSGLARGFKSLLVTRAFVGVGEASYAPSATAMIADNFHHRMRARVQGLFHIGMFLGGTIGAMIGGVIVSLTDSWRLAFFIVSIPGIFLALSMLWVKDKRIKHTHTDFTLKPLFKNPAYILILVSGTFAAFTTNAFVSWGIEYIRRYTPFDLLDASLVLGTSVIIAGTLGVLIGSHVADYWQKKTDAGRSIVVGLSLLLAIPFIFLGFAWSAQGFMFMIFFTLGITFMSFYFGPVAAVIQDVIPANIRATAFAVYVFVIHLLGGAVAPAAIGKLSDMFNLQVALQIATLGELIAGGIFLGIAWMIHKGAVRLQHHDEVEVVDALI